jgi:hypothetical protein
MCVPIVTTWTNSSSAVQLVQLSDDPADGTPQEQIARFAAYDFLQGYTCVDSDYRGTAPETDVSLWRWDGSKIVSLAPPAPPPMTIDQALAKISALEARIATLEAGGP